MVVQNPSDKQGLRGFIKLARVHSMGSVIDGNSEAAATGGLNIQEIDILCDMINEWTGLRADFAGSFTFDDERLLDIPIIMPHGTPTEGELQDMARYLFGGLRAAGRVEQGPGAAGAQGHLWGLEQGLGEIRWFDRAARLLYRAPAR